MRYPGERRRGRFLGRLLIIVLLAGYILVAMHPVPPQPTVERQWSLRPEEAVVGAGDREEELRWIPFRTDNRFGYVSPSGELLLREEILDGTALSERGYVNYTSLGEDLVLQIPRERFMYSIEGGGIPFFRGGRLWLLAHDHTGITAVSGTGERRYRLEFGTIVTCVDSRQDLTAVGLLDGTVRLFDDSGRLRWTIGGEGEGSGAVYGAALSPDVGRVAFIRGLDPQQLLIYTISRNGPVREYVGRRREALRREIQMDFSREGDLLLTETAGGVRLRRLESGRERSLPVEGVVTDYLLTSARQPIFIASAGEENGTLTIASAEEGVYSRERYPAAVTMLEGGDDEVYVSTGGAVHKVRALCE